jgi:hypothetical protein
LNIYLSRPIPPKLLKFRLYYQARAGGSRKISEGGEQVGDVEDLRGADSQLQGGLRGDFFRPFHDQWNSNSTFVDRSFVPSQTAVCVELNVVAAGRSAVVRLKNYESVVGNRVGSVAVVVRVFKSGEDIAKVSVDAGHNGGPLL